MATRDDIIYLTMGVKEGSAYTDRKNDRGGKTKYGIIETTTLQYKHLWAKHGFTGDMRLLPEGLAFDIYVEIWNSMKLDAVHAIDWQLAEKIFDLGVNKGGGFAGKYLQRMLNALNNQAKLYPDLKIDGDIGPTTIGRLNDYVKVRGKQGIQIMIFALFILQGNSYVVMSEGDVSQEENAYGWMVRILRDFLSFSKDWKM